MRAELVTLEGDFDYYDYPEYQLNGDSFPDEIDLQMIYSDPELMGFWAAIAKVGAKVGKGLFKGVRKAVRRKRAKKKRKAAAAKKAKIEEQQRQAAIQYQRQIALQQQAKKKEQQNKLMTMLPLLALPLLLGE